MSAGYILYSLDTEKFHRLVASPTDAELSAFGKLIADGLEECDGEFDEDDPIAQWPTDATSLAQLAAGRLALPDWYGDLSGSGKSLWEGVVFGTCQNHKKFDVGFRVDHDGIYWDVIEIAWKQLGVPQGTINDVALSTFGTRPYRYHPRPKPKKKSWFSGDDDGWTPMHSMHLPYEVAKMQAELKSVAPAMSAPRNQGAREDYESVLPAFEKIVRDG